MASLQPYYICIFIVGDFVDNLSLDMYNSIKNNYEKKKKGKKKRVIQRASTFRNQHNLIVVKSI